MVREQGRDEDTATALIRRPMSDMLSVLDLFGSQFFLRLLNAFLISLYT
jgi:hypothetical protein